MVKSRYLAVRNATNLGNTNARVDVCHVPVIPHVL